MTVMLRLTSNISKDILFPEKAKSNREGSAQIRLAKELFGKYKGPVMFFFVLLYFCAVLKFFLFFFFSGYVVVKISMVFFKDLDDLLPKRAVGIKR